MSFTDAQNVITVVNSGFVDVFSGYKKTVRCQTN